MILYHGTNAVFEEFSNDYISTEDSIDQYGSGFYFYDDFSRTALHGGITIIANVEVRNPMPHDKIVKPLSMDEIETLLCYSSNLEYKLSDFGDIEYHGFDKVLRTACKTYTSFTDYVSLLNVIGNDFFDPKDTWILLREFVKMTGVDCFTDLKRGIYVILTKRQIEIQKIVFNFQEQGE